jgi:putative effector of murein hydrolase
VSYILFATVLTLAAFALTRWLGARSGHHPLVNPILLAAALVLAGLYAASMDYRVYRIAAEPLRWLLGPAIVALALPIWRERHRLRAHAVAISLSVLGGATLGAGLGIGAALALGLPQQLVLALAPKTTTSPFAIKIMEQLGGSPTLAAVFVILSGAVSAIFLPGLLTVAGIRQPEARGLALGGAGHIVGTQRAATESPVSGSLAALAMALTGLATAVIVPVAWRFIFS